MKRDKDHPIFPSYYDFYQSKDTNFSKPLQTSFAVLPRKLPASLTVPPTKLPTSFVVLLTRLIASFVVPATTLMTSTVPVMTAFPASFNVYDTSWITFWALAGMLSLSRTTMSRREPGK